MLKGEYQRPNRHWLWARWIATLIAIIGLAGTGLSIVNSALKEVDSSEKRKKGEEKKIHNTDGFMDIHWDHELKSGEPLCVQGQYRNSLGTPVSISLVGFQAGLDSTLIPAGQVYLFSLKTIPKQTGNGLFQVLVREQNNTLETEPIPFTVSQPDSLNILILSSSPDFENKFLIQWLSDHHIGVVERTRISQDRFEKIYLNRPPLAFNQVNGNLLRQFELLICDASAFSNLSNLERTAVQRQVDEKGMGMLIRMDSSDSKKTSFNKLFPVYHYVAKSDQLRVIFASDSSQGMEYTGEKAMVGIRILPGTQPLAQDDDGHVLVSRGLKGLGKIGFTTLHGTYLWSLSGNITGYGKFWTYVIHHMAKQKQESIRLWAAEKFPKKDEAVRFIAESGKSPLPPPFIGGTPFYLKQGKNDLLRWTGCFWPKQTGWQPGVQAAGRHFEWFVYDSADWCGFSITGREKLEIPKADNRNGSRLYFLLFWMSGCMFLWIERKIFLI